MEVENITTLSYEPFMVEAVVPIERTPVDIMEVAGPPTGMIGTINLLEEIRKKMVDSICVPKESLIESIFSSPMVSSSNNP